MTIDFQALARPMMAHCVRELAKARNRIESSFTWARYEMWDRDHFQAIMGGRLDPREDVWDNRRRKAVA